MSNASSTSSAPAAAPADDDEPRPSYDAQSLAGGTFGRFHDDYRKSHMVRLEPDVAEGFQDEQAVNDALRIVMQLRRVPDAKQQDVKAAS